MKIRLIAISLSFLILACSEGENCTNRELNITSLENEYGCTNTKNSDIEISEGYKIIRNQTEFEALNFGNCDPEIDFSKYDLIIGKYQLTTGNNSIDYDLVENCQTKNLILKIAFNQNETAEAPNVTYHALIPKLEIGQSISIEYAVQ
ncbi:hypothetical protein C7S20_02665 [Christiangramia fulva]|uniref:Uncharacterized protein n=1 Tax=Christiangramia fulva TaxID=2126553 RepID=A0A2R3Z1T9_9FLAO|nr:hypothetical protein [Christiangramia fulva]AVR44250.1 hypothetical protein C7S20_02665 [Christiangramia fulva]